VQSGVLYVTNKAYTSGMHLSHRAWTGSRSGLDFGPGFEVQARAVP
jgi:hypothetical protein